MSNIKISRDSQLLNKVVIVDGFPGCGKTMLSPIISSFNKVEIMQYAPVIEQAAELWGLNKIDDDVATSLIRMNADLLIYNVMMGRNTNCRPSDISSIFRDKPFRYLSRMLKKGDEIVPELIARNAPILHLTTHMLLPNAKPIFDALGDKLTFLEVVRHPLYMIIQQEKNFKMFEGVRNQHIRYSKNNKEYTFFNDGWEDKFDISNTYEKSIYSMKWYYDKLSSIRHHNCLIIPFEKFVKKPDEYMLRISKHISSAITKNVTTEMKKQKVPRGMLTDSPALKIYKRCGWKPPTGGSESDELEDRRNLIAENVSSDALAILDSICKAYTEKYINKEL